MARQLKNMLGGKNREKLFRARNMHIEEGLDQTTQFLAHACLEATGICQIRAEWEKAQAANLIQRTLTV